MGRFSTIRGLLYPSDIYCMACGAIIDATRSYALCDSCVSEIHWIGLFHCCEGCGRPLARSKKGGLCENCELSYPSFDSGIACMEYGTNEREMILSYKYNDRPYMAEKLGDIMADSFYAREELPAAELIVPVPSHPKKLRERGYNQAELLAKRLGKRLGLPVLSDVLIKKRHEDAMSHMGLEKRKSSARDNFALNEKRRGVVEGKRVLLVDDIITTGSTARSCSTALKSAGASKVDFMALAAVPERDMISR